VLLGESGAAPPGLLAHVLEARGAAAIEVGAVTVCPCWVEASDSLVESLGALLRGCCCC